MKTLFNLFLNLFGLRYIIEMTYTGHDENFEYAVREALSMFQKLGSGYTITGQTRDIEYLARYGTNLCHASVLLNCFADAFKIEDYELTISKYTPHAETNSIKKVRDNVVAWLTDRSTYPWNFGQCELE